MQFDYNVISNNWTEPQSLIALSHQLTLPHFSHTFSPHGVMQSHNFVIPFLRMNLFGMFSKRIHWSHAESLFLLKFFKCFQWNHLCHIHIYITTIASCISHSHISTPSSTHGVMRSHNFWISFLGWNGLDSYTRGFIGVMQSHFWSWNFSNVSNGTIIATFIFT